VLFRVSDDDVEELVISDNDDKAGERTEEDVDSKLGCLVVDTTAVVVDDDDDDDGDDMLPLAFSFGARVFTFRFEGDVGVAAADDDDDDEGLSANGTSILGDCLDNDSDDDGDSDVEDVGCWRRDGVVGALLRRPLVNKCSVAPLHDPLDVNVVSL
jgi:hypothetical protein